LNKIVSFIFGLIFKSFFGGTSKAMSIGIICAVLAGVASGGFFIYHLGYIAAANKCHEAAIQSQLEAEKLKEKNLQDQIAAGTKTIVVINKKKQDIQQAADNATTVVTNEIKDNTSCDITPDVVSLLNNLRSTSGSH